MITWYALNGTIVSNSAHLNEQFSPGELYSLWLDGIRK